MEFMFRVFLEDDVLNLYRRLMHTKLFLLSINSAHGEDNESFVGR